MGDGVPGSAARGGARICAMRVPESPDAGSMTPMRALGSLHRTVRGGPRTCSWGYRSGRPGQEKHAFGENSDPVMRHLVCLHGSKVFLGVRWPCLGNQSLGRAS